MAATLRGFLRVSAWHGWLFESTIRRLIRTGASRAYCWIAPLLSGNYEGTTWMPAVKVKENEPFDVALRRFKRSCEKAGVLADVRSREFYEKPTSERKRKAAAAVKRHAKKVQREQRRRERLY